MMYLKKTAHIWFNVFSSLEFLQEKQEEYKRLPSKSASRRKTAVGTMVDGQKKIIIYHYLSLFIRILILFIHIIFIIISNSNSINFY